MPEGPEIRTAANFINKVCETQTFSGPVVRGPLAVKLPLVEFAADSYSLRAEARGKELKVSLPTYIVSIKYLLLLEAIILPSCN